MERGRDPYNPSVNDILDFLYHRFSLGDSVYALKVHRSALALGFEAMVSPAVKSPIISRFLNGCLALRPPNIRTVLNWDPDTILLMLRSWVSAQYLRLPDLAAKTIFLINLATGCRAGEISGMDINHFVENSVGMTFTLQKPTKCYNINRMDSELQKLEVIANPQEPDLCPVENIKIYMQRTNSIRNSSQLFVASHPTLCSAFNAENF